MSVFGVLSANPGIQQRSRLSSPKPAPDRSRGYRASRILLANDNLVFRDGLRSLLEGDECLQVIGGSSDGEAALQLALEIRPDILLLDWALACQDEMRILKEISASSHPVRTLLVSVPHDNAAIVKALRSGAWGVVLKNSTAQMLLRAIHWVLDGQYWIGYECASSLIEALHDVSFWRKELAALSNFGLTTREREVIQKVVEGYSNAEIAKHLSLSQNTVKHHLSNIFDKVGVSTRLELAFFAVNHRLINPNV